MIRVLVEAGLKSSMCLDTMLSGISQVSKIEGHLSTLLFGYCPLIIMIHYADDNADDDDDDGDNYGGETAT